MGMNIIYCIDILVGGIPTRLKNMSSSVGMIIPRILWKIKNVPNHQPAYIYIYMYDTVPIPTKQETYKLAN